MTDEFEDDEKIKKAIALRDKRRRDREIGDLKKLLSMPEGRRFLWRVLTEAGVYRGVFNQNALSMAFSDGRRDIGLFILKDIDEFAPDAYTQMKREYRSDLKAEKIEMKKGEINE